MIDPNIEQNPSFRKLHFSIKHLKTQTQKFLQKIHNFRKFTVSKNSNKTYLKISFLEKNDLNKKVILMKLQKSNFRKFLKFLRFLVDRNIV